MRLVPCKRYQIESLALLWDLGAVYVLYMSTALSVSSYYMTTIGIQK